MPRQNILLSLYLYFVICFLFNFDIQYVYGLLYGGAEFQHHKRELEMTIQSRVTEYGAQPVASNAKELRAAVVTHLRVLKERTWRTGYTGIEHMRPEDVAKLPVAVNHGNGKGVPIPTVFAAIGDIMATAGYTGDTKTVGGVTEGLLGRKDLDAAKQLAHDIGCHCVLVTAGRAADAIDALND